MCRDRLQHDDSDDNELTEEGCLLREALTTLLRIVDHAVRNDRDMGLSSGGYHGCASIYYEVDSASLYSLVCIYLSKSHMSLFDREFHRTTCDTSQQYRSGPVILKSITIRYYKVITYRLNWVRRHTEHQAWHWPPLPDPWW